MFDLPCGVRLREFRLGDEKSSSPSDLDHILSIYNNAELAPLISKEFVVPRGQKLKDKFKEAIENNAEMFCIIESIPPTSSTESPQFLGLACLWSVGERGMRASSFSILIIPGSQNKGYGTAVTQFMVDYAFVHLYMHRVSLSVLDGNDRALAVYRKCGFVQEGRSRKSVWVAGQWKDHINMSILIDEWQAFNLEKDRKIV